MDTDKISLRIAQILKHYELSASSFADSIQVQRSSISHLLKGRNKPSLEFVTKLVHAYPEVNLYWLLYGEGEFPKGTSTHASINTKNKTQNKPAIETTEKKVEKVIVFYEDGTFSSYTPEA
ncbi:MAG: transcriptional regulator with XRE-family HTH domain [Maribacter sp.]|jgi:transcriptional regulator with XRE-family HTH domain